jgi:lipopolysaccharide biosynthesis regulator YciM
VKGLKDELEEKVTELRKERDEIAFRAIQHIRNLYQKNVDWPQDLTAALASAVTNEDIASVLSQLEHECDDIASHRIKDSRGRSML